MLNPQNLPYGGEQYETYKPATRSAGKRVQYDYKHHDGELFSCVKRTLDECRAARDSWLSQKGERGPLPLRDWLNNLLEVPTKDPALMYRSICAYCKYRGTPADEPPCSGCNFNIGHWEFAEPPTTA